MHSSMILTYLTIWVSKGKSIFQKMTWLLWHIDKSGIDYLKFGCWLLYNNKQQRFLLGGIVVVVIVIVRRDRNRSTLASNIIPTIIVDYQHDKIPKSPFCSRYCSSSIFCARVVHLFHPIQFEVHERLPTTGQSIIVVDASSDLLEMSVVHM